LFRRTPVRSARQQSKGDTLGSPLRAKEEPLTLSMLWDSLPENRPAPLGDDGMSRRTPLYLDHQVLHPDPHPLVSVPVAYFPPG
jgi:hypothetical protein